MIPSKAVKFLAFLIIALAIALVMAFIPFSARHNAVMVQKDRFLMGTIVRIKAPVGPSEDPKHVKKAIDKALDEIARIEGVFSVYKPDSEISKINRLRKAETLKISDEAFELIEKSIEFNKKSHGAFDITVRPLVDLWRSAGQTGQLPSKDAVSAALARVGSGYIILDKSAKTLSFAKDGMSLDMGAIGKGYASDRAVKVLRESGITNAIVNPGGDVYCLGQRAPGKLWNVGIQHPRQKGKLLFELELKDKAIDTAGDYEKFFILDGKRYSHIIDPRTGYPIGDGTVSASVIANDATTADALATALCVLGAEGSKIIDTKTGEAAVIIVKKDDGQVSVVTTGIMGRYNVKKKIEL